MRVTTMKAGKKIKILQKEVSVLDADVRELQNVLLKLNTSEQEEKDKEELKKIEAQME